MAYAFTWAVAIAFWLLAWALTLWLDRTRERDERRQRELDEAFRSFLKSETRRKR